MPVFALELKFDDKGSVVAVKRLNQIGSAASDTENEVRRLGESLKNAAQNVLALVGHCKTIGAMKDFVRRGAEFNSYMESGRIGIASLITSMVNLEDAQGRTLEGAEKYAAAQGLAADMMKEIQRLGLETTATAQELVEGVQSVMGPAVQAGLKLNEIPAFAVAAAQAVAGDVPDVRALHLDGAAVHLEQSEDHLDGGGLAGPVGPQKAHDLPGHHRKAGVPDDGFLADFLVEVLHL